eukprot:TRINITY_DN6414_c0_g1_i1.p1 TRINITY_DN6414_c0_g1~~TRINITY_DN6414_c0_g1_i1.p1  ORF type:complete len:967 (+),score=156.12 TRINITY_DN6414_c0_g1_i1:3-2903(+)
MTSRLRQIKCHVKNKSKMISVHPSSHLDDLLRMCKIEFNMKKDPYVVKYRDAYGDVIEISKNSDFNLQVQLSSSGRVGEDFFIEVWMDDNTRKRSYSVNHQGEGYLLSDPLAKSDPNIIPSWREYEPLYERERFSNTQINSSSQDLFDSGALKPYETAMVFGSSWDDLRIDTDGLSSGSEYGRVTPTTPVLKTPPSMSSSPTIDNLSINSHIFSNTDYDLPSFHQTPIPTKNGITIRSPSFRHEFNDTMESSDSQDIELSTLPGTKDSVKFQFKKEESFSESSDMEQSSYSNDSDEDIWDPSKWRKCRKLVDRGANGSVYEGLTMKGEIVAVKQLDIPTENLSPQLEAQIKSFRKEIDVLKTLKHPHIVRYLGSYFHTEYIYIFLEFVPGGSIRTLMSKFGPLDEILMKLYCRQILQGLQYLHDQRVIHRDIKCANILVDTRGVAKLADFGCAKILNDLKSQVHSLLGTPFWMAPEVLLEQGHDFSADIWSFGCTIVEMATADLPYRSKQYSHVHAFILDVCTKNVTPDIPENLSEIAKEFISSTLIRDPKKRPSTQELLKSPWVKVKGKKRTAKQDHTAKKMMAANTISLMDQNDYTSIPSNLAKKIFKLLDMGSLLSVSAVCSRWRSLSNLPAIWNYQILKEWPKCEPQGTKKEYIERYRSDCKWEKKRYKELISFRPHRKLSSVTMLHKSKRIVSSGQEKKLKIWEFTNLSLELRTKVRNTQLKTPSVVNILASDNEEKYIIGSGEDYNIRLWNIKEKELYHSYVAHEDHINALKYHNGTIYSASQDGTIGLFDLAGGEISQTIATGHEITNIDMKGDLIITAQDNNLVTLYDSRTGSKERHWKYHKDRVTSVLFAGDIILSGSSGVICEWSHHSRKPLSILKAEGSVNQIKFDGLNHLLALGDDTISVWDFNKERLIWKHHDKKIKSSYLMECDWNSEICIMAHEKSMRVLQLHTSKLDHSM